MIRCGRMRWCVIRGSKLIGCVVCHLGRADSKSGRSRSKLDFKGVGGKQRQGVGVQVQRGGRGGQPADHVTPSCSTSTPTTPSSKTISSSNTNSTIISGTSGIHLWNSSSSNARRTARVACKGVWVGGGCVGVGVCVCVGGGGVIG